MRRVVVALAVVLTAAGLAPPASGAETARGLAVTTDAAAVLLSTQHVEVRGSVTCAGHMEVGTVGVVLIQPPGSIAQDGGGSIPFSCAAGQTVRWAALVTAGEFSDFRTGRARFSTYASTSCSDSENDCPSASADGILTIKAASHGDGIAITPKHLRFGKQLFESLTKRTFTITNTGTRTLDVSIETTSVPDDFSPGQPESTCPLAGVGINVLLPGQSCTHTVAFQPARVFDQPERALITITSRDLTGTVIDVSRVRISGHGY